MASKQSTDETFVLYEKDGKFYIGDSEVNISGVDIIIGNDTYYGTVGLWELITSKNPVAEIYTIEKTSKTTRAFYLKLTQ